MSKERSVKVRLLGGLSLAVIAGTPGSALAQDLPQTTGFEIRRLNDMVDLQREQLEQQERALRQQQERIEALERAFLGVRSPGQAGYVPAVTAPAYPAEHQAANVQNAQAGDAVGEPPDPAEVMRELEDIAGLREVGGVLTPPGSLVFEPSIEYEQTSTNRFFFNGVQIADVVLVGDLEVSDADRDAITAAAAFRTGITSRSELEVRVPFVYRDDRVTQSTIGGSSTSTTSELDNANIGDVEVTGRYQLNSGTGGWPIFIGNLRVKTTTGEGPFDIDRDASGIETELSTGSGFWAVEPSVTWIFPTDPAVFYGNFSYLWNIEDDVDETITADRRIGDVDPGDVFGFAFGMGYSLNEKTSFSVGYEHKFVFETDQDITDTSGGTPITNTVSSEEFDVGTLSFGFSYALNNRTSLNLTLQTGVTEDAPDVRMLLRVPIRFDVF